MSEHTEQVNEKVVLESDSMSPLICKECPEKESKESEDSDYDDMPPLICEECAEKESKESEKELQKESKDSNESDDSDDMPPLVCEECVTKNCENMCFCDERCECPNCDCNSLSTKDSSSESSSDSSESSSDSEESEDKPRVVIHRVQCDETDIPMSVYVVIGLYLLLKFVNLLLLAERCFTK